MIRGGHLYVPAGWKEFYEYSPEDRRSVTVIEGICADGRVIPGMTIISGSVYMDDWFNSQQSGEEIIALSDSGYTNTELGLYWLAHFIKHAGLQKNGETPSIVLFMDSHSSHLSNAFEMMAEEYGIILRKFIRHSTHLLQPLDVKCFNPHKYWHSCAIKKAIRQGEAIYNIVSFLYDLPSIRRQALTPSTIKSGFKATGLWPFDSEVTINQLKGFEPSKAPYHAQSSYNHNDPTNPSNLQTTIAGLELVDKLLSDRLKARPDQTLLSDSPQKLVKRVFEKAAVILGTAEGEVIQL